MLGGRPRSDVTKLQVATALGNSGAWAGGGIYVDGALKEEFGLAVLEALAAGLVVVAPSTGGPATYVDHGDTGILAEPGADLAQAIHAAFELVNRPGRASRASALVRDRYSIDTMAEQLAELYRPVMALR
jgi:glycosyltransferase involved in cell wall biosynthesis